MGDFLGGLLCPCCSIAQCFYCKSSVRMKSLQNLTKLFHKILRFWVVYFCSPLTTPFYALQILGKLIDIRLKSPGWIKSLEDEMNVERICGSLPTSASSTLLAEDTDMGDDDYDMEGME